jgi:SAM-dependent methyltransferase
LDIRTHNRDAWNKEVEKGNPWTIPVSRGQIAAAREGIWSVLLTPTIPVPANWFPSLPGLDLLGLASSGGQQAPIFAAAGANVTVLDNSPRQLARDKEVAEREGLKLRLVEGDMRDLSVFPDASFDLIFHPVSNVFVDDVIAVWKEAFRVLRPGGALLAGVCNPVMYIFDMEKLDQGQMVVKHPLPYSDVQNMDPIALQKWITDQNTLEWSHTLDEQIGGQLSAGFTLTGFYEDRDPGSVLSQFMPTFIATRTIKSGN